MAKRRTQVELNDTNRKLVFAESYRRSKKENKPVSMTQVVNDRLLTSYGK